MQPGEGDGGTQRALLTERIAGPSTGRLHIAGEQCRSGLAHRAAVAQPTYHRGRGNGGFAEAVLHGDQAKRLLHPFFERFDICRIRGQRRGPNARSDQLVRQDPDVAAGAGEPQPQDHIRLDVGRRLVSAEGIPGVASNRADVVRHALVEQFGERG